MSKQLQLTSALSTSQLATTAAAVQFLLQAASLGLPPLHTAALCGDVDKVRQLLSSGTANPNQLAPAGGTPLHYAMRFATRPLMEALLQGGASLDLPALPGKDTALHIAARDNLLAAVRQLLQSQVSVDARMANGATPLLLAAQFGSKNAIEALHAGGAGGCGALCESCKG